MKKIFAIAITSSILFNLESIATGKKAHIQAQKRYQHCLQIALLEDLKRVGMKNPEIPQEKDKGENSISKLKEENKQLQKMLPTAKKNYEKKIKEKKNATTSAWLRFLTFEW